MLRAVSSAAGISAGELVASVNAATTAALANTPTYDNGVSGVGATLTAGSNGALPAQDGITLIVGDRLLVKNQASALQNGIYTVTQVGTAGTPYILTRSSDFDSSSEITYGTLVPVDAGTTQAGTVWMLTGSGSITVGTTALNFTQVNFVANAVTAAAVLTAGRLTMGDGARGIADATAATIGTSLAIGGATIGSNALAVTGTSLFTGAVTIASGGLSFSTTNTLDIGTAIGTLAPRNIFAGTLLSAPKAVITAGTLGDQAQAIVLTATQPASPTGTQRAITATITSAGSASQYSAGMFISYAAGYTGNSGTNALEVSNTVASTGTDIFSGLGNFGFVGAATATTVGTNGGGFNLASGGNINYGTISMAVTDKASAQNVGVGGFARNAGAAGNRIAGFFGLYSSLPTLGVTAALIADNSNVAADIFVARDNGTPVFTIADGGGVTTTGNITKLGGAALLTTSTALTDGAGVGVGTLTNAPASTNPTKWIPINDNGTTRHIPAW